MSTCTPAASTRSRSSSPSHGGSRSAAGRPPSPERSAMQIEQLQALNANKKMLLDESKRALDDYRSLTGEKGRSMTFEEGRMALALILGLQIHFDKNDTDSINTASMLLGKSNKTLITLLHHWRKSHEVLVPSSSIRGAGSPYHRYHDVQLESEHISTIHRTIVEANEDGSGCTTQMILDALKQEHGLTIGNRTLRRILNRIGYRAIMMGWNNY